MLGSCNSVSRGRVHHQATVLGGRSQIHIINAHAGPPDHLQPPARGLEHLAGHLGPAPHDQRVAERDLGAQLLGAEVVGAIDVGEVLEEVEARLAELLGDEHRRLGVEPRRRDHQHEPLPRASSARDDADAEDGGERELR